MSLKVVIALSTLYVTSAIFLTDVQSGLKWGAVSIAVAACILTMLPSVFDKAAQLCLQWVLLRRFFVSTCGDSKLDVRVSSSIMQGKIKLEIKRMKLTTKCLDNLMNGDKLDPMLLTRGAAESLTFLLQFGFQKSVPTYVEGKRNDELGERTFMRLPLTAWPMMSAWVTAKGLDIEFKMRENCVPISMSRILSQKRAALQDVDRILQEDLFGSHQSLRAQKFVSWTIRLLRFTNVDFRDMIVRYLHSSEPSMFEIQMSRLLIRSQSYVCCDFTSSSKEYRPFSTFTDENILETKRPADDFAKEINIRFTGFAIDVCEEEDGDKIRLLQGWGGDAMLMLDPRRRRGGEGLNPEVVPAMLRTELLTLDSDESRVSMIEAEARQKPSISVAFQAKPIHCTVPIKYAWRMNNIVNDWILATKLKLIKRTRPDSSIKHRPELWWKYVVNAVIAINICRNPVANWCTSGENSSTLDNSITCDRGGYILVNRALARNGSFDLKVLQNRRRLRNKYIELYSKFLTSKNSWKGFALRRSFPVFWRRLVQGVENLESAMDYGDIILYRCIALSTNRSLMHSYLNRREDESIHPTKLSGGHLLRFVRSYFDAAKRPSIATLHNYLIQARREIILPVYFVTESITIPAITVDIRMDCKYLASTISKVSATLRGIRCIGAGRRSSKYALLSTIESSHVTLSCSDPKSNAKSSTEEILRTQQLSREDYFFHFCILVDDKRMYLPLASAFRANDPTIIANVGSPLVNVSVHVAPIYFFADVALVYAVADNINKSALGAQCGIFRSSASDSFDYGVVSSIPDVFEVPSIPTRSAKQNCLRCDLLLDGLHLILCEIVSNEKDVVDGRKRIIVIEVTSISVRNASEEQFMSGTIIGAKIADRNTIESADVPNEPAMHFDEAVQPEMGGGGKSFPHLRLHNADMCTAFNINCALSSKMVSSEHYDKDVPSQKLPSKTILLHLIRIDAGLATRYPSFGLSSHLHVRTSRVNFVVNPDMLAYVADKVEALSIYTDGHKESADLTSREYSSRHRSFQIEIPSIHILCQNVAGTVPGDVLEINLLKVEFAAQNNVEIIRDGTFPTATTTSSFAFCSNRIFLSEQRFGTAGSFTIAEVLPAPIVQPTGLSNGIDTSKDPHFCCSDNVGPILQNKSGTKVGGLSCRKADGAFALHIHGMTTSNAIRVRAACGSIILLNRVPAVVEFLSDARVITTLSAFLNAGSTGEWENPDDGSSHQAHPEYDVAHDQGEVRHRPKKSIGFLLSLYKAEFLHVEEQSIEDSPWIFQRWVKEMRNLPQHATSQLPANCIRLKVHSVNIVGEVGEDVFNFNVGVACISIDESLSLCCRRFSTIIEREAHPRPSCRTVFEIKAPSEYEAGPDPTAMNVSFRLEYGAAQENGSLIIFVGGSTSILYIKPVYDEAVYIVSQISKALNSTVAQIPTKETSTRRKSPFVSAVKLSVHLELTKLIVPRSHQALETDAVIATASAVDIKKLADDGAISIRSREAQVNLREYGTRERIHVCTSPSIEGKIVANLSSYTFNLKAKSMDLCLTKAICSTLLGTIFEHYLSGSTNAVSDSSRAPVYDFTLEVSRIRCSINGWLTGIPDSSMVLLLNSFNLSVIYCRDSDDKNSPDGGDLMLVTATGETLHLQQQPSRGPRQSDCSPREFHEGRVDLLCVQDARERETEREEDMSSDSPDSDSRPFRVVHRLCVNGSQDTEIYFDHAKSVWPTLLSIDPIWDLVAIFFSYFKSEAYLSQKAVEAYSDSETEGGYASPIVSRMSIEMTESEVFFPCSGRRAGGHGGAPGWRHGLTFSADSLSLQFSWDNAGNSRVIAAVYGAGGTIRQDDNVSKIIDKYVPSKISFDRAIQNFVECEDALEISDLSLILEMSTLPVIRSLSERVRVWALAKEECDTEGAVSLGDNVVDFDEDQESKASFERHNRTEHMNNEIQDSGAQEKLGVIYELSEDDEIDNDEIEEEEEDVIDEPEDNHATEEDVIDDIMEDLISGAEEIEDIVDSEHLFFDEGGRSDAGMRVMDRYRDEQVSDRGASNFEDPIAVKLRSPYRFIIRYLIKNTCFVLCDDISTTFSTTLKSTTEFFNDVTPLLRCTLHRIGGDYLSSGDNVSDTEVTINASIDYHNTEVERFESLVEPWEVNLRYNKGKIAQFSVESDQRMSITLTPSQVRVISRLSRVRKVWEDYPGAYVKTERMRWHKAVEMSQRHTRSHNPKTNVDASFSGDKNAEYILRNETGIRVWFWLGGVVEAQALLLASGRERHLKLPDILEFDQGIGGPRRKNTLITREQKKGHTIHIQLDGGWKPLRLVALRKTGRYSLIAESLLSDLKIPLVAEVVRRGRVHVLSIHSSLRIVNETQRNLEFKFSHLHDAASAAHVPCSFGPVVAEGGSMYVPLPAVVDASMGLRAAGFGWSQEANMTLSLVQKELVALQGIYTSPASGLSAASASDNAISSHDFHMVLQVVEFSRVVVWDLNHDNAALGSEGVYDLIFSSPLVVYNMLPHPYTIEVLLNTSEGSSWNGAHNNNNRDSKIQATAPEADMTLSGEKASGHNRSKSAEEAIFRSNSPNPIGRSRTSIPISSERAMFHKWKNTASERSDAGDDAEASGRSDLWARVLQDIPFTSRLKHQLKSFRGETSSRNIHQASNAVEPGKSKHVYMLNTLSQAVRMTIRLRTPIDTETEILSETSGIATSKSTQVLDLQTINSNAKPKKIHLWLQSGPQSMWRKITLLLDIKVIRSGSSAYSISIYSPFLVFNLTPTQLLCRESGFGGSMTSMNQSKHFVESAPMKKTGHDWVPRPPALLFAKRKQIKIRSFDSDWSRSVDLTKVGLDGTLRLTGGYNQTRLGSDGKVSLTDKVSTVLKERGSYYHMIGINLRYGPSMLRSSELIVISPAFILSNRSGRVIEIKQANISDDQNVIGKLADNDVMPLMSVVSLAGGQGNSDLEFVVRYREVRLRLDSLLSDDDGIQAEESEIEEAWWEWSYPFRINEAGEQIIRVYGVNGEGPPHLVPIYITVKGASTIVVFGKEEEMIAPYRIDNKSNNVRVFVAQKGIEEYTWEAIAPGKSLAYAWDAPLQPHRLKVRLEHANIQGIRFSPISKEYSLDEIHSRPAIKFKQANPHVSGVRRKVTGPALGDLTQKLTKKESIVTSRAAQVQNINADKLIVQLRAEGPFRVLSFTLSKGETEREAQELLMAKQRLHALERQIQNVDRIIDGIEHEGLNMAGIPSSSRVTTPHGGLDYPSSDTARDYQAPLTPAVAMLRSAKSFLSQRSIKLGNVESIEEISSRSAMPNFMANSSSSPAVVGEGGELVCRVVRAFGLLTASLETSDPDQASMNTYCKLSCNNKTNVTEIMRATNEPVWEQDMIFNGVQLQDVLSIEIFDSKKSADDELLGEAQLPLQDLDDELLGEEQTLTLVKNVPTSTIVGSIVLAISWNRTPLEQITLLVKAKEQELVIKENILNLVDHEMSKLPQSLSKFRSDDSSDVASSSETSTMCDNLDDMITNDLRSSSGIKGRTWKDIQEQRRQDEIYEKYRVDIRLISGRNIQTRHANNGLCARFSVRSQEEISEKSKLRIQTGGRKKEKKRKNVNVPIRTNVVYATTNPEWNENGTFHKVSLTSEVRVDVIEKSKRGGFGELLIGTAKLPLKVLSGNAQTQYIWLPLEMAKASDAVPRAVGQLPMKVFSQSFMGKPNPQAGLESGEIGDVRIRVELTPDVEGSESTDGAVDDFRDGTMEMEFRARFGSGVGVSLQEIWDRDREISELVHFMLADIDVEWKCNKEDHSVRIAVMQIQVDNMLSNADYPVLMRQTLADGDGLAALEVAWVRTNNELSSHHFRYLSVLLQEADMHVEESLMDRLSCSFHDLEREFASYYVDRRSSQENLKSWLRSRNTSALAQFVTSDFTSGGGALEEELMSALFNPLQETKDAPSPQSSNKAKLYFDLLHLHPIKLNVSVYSSQSNAAAFEAHMNRNTGQTLRFSGMTGIPVINMKDAPLRLDSLLLEHIYLDGNELIFRLAAHYKRKGLQEIYKLIGSVEFLGSPTSLVSNLGTGMLSLFYEPARGIVQSPQDFGKGLATGMQSLVKHSVYGFFNTFSTMTGSAAKGLQAVVGDPEFQWSEQQKKQRFGRAAARQMVNEQPARGQLRNMRTGVIDGVKDLGAGLFGISDIVTKSYEGARGAGVRGFIVGFGQGAVGTFVKPLAGCLQLVSRTTGGVRGLAEDRNMRPMARIRTPRVIPPQGAPLLDEWTGEQAMGEWLSSRSQRYLERRLTSGLSNRATTDALLTSLRPSQTTLLLNTQLRKIRNGKYKQEELQGYSYIGAKILLATDERIIYMHKLTHAVDWVIKLDRIAKIKIANEDIQIISFASHAAGQNAWKRWTASADVELGSSLNCLDRFLLRSSNIWCPTRDLQKRLLSHLKDILRERNTSRGTVELEQADAGGDEVEIVYDDSHFVEGREMLPSESEEGVSDVLQEQGEDGQHGKISEDE